MEIDSHYPDKIQLKVAHSGFNIGFELNFWLKWCKLLHCKPFSPIQDAARLLNSDQDNYLKNHPKLRYTEGHVWLYLKASTQKECESLYEVSKHSSQINGSPLVLSKKLIEMFKIYYSFIMPVQFYLTEIPLSVGNDKFCCR